MNDGAGSDPELTKKDKVVHVRVPGAMYDVLDGMAIQSDHVNSVSEYVRSLIYMAVLPLYRRKIDASDVPEKVIDPDEALIIDVDLCEEVSE